MPPRDACAGSSSVVDASDLVVSRAGIAARDACACTGSRSVLHLAVSAVYNSAQQHPRACNKLTWLSSSLATRSLIQMDTSFSDRLYCSGADWSEGRGLSSLLPLWSAHLSTSTKRYSPDSLTTSTSDEVFPLFDLSQELVSLGQVFSAADCAQSVEGIVWWCYRCSRAD